MTLGAMSRTNVFAYTEVGGSSFPGYISINVEESGRPSIAVRSSGGVNQAVLEVDSSVLDSLCAALARYALDRSGEG